MLDYLEFFLGGIGLILTALLVTIVVTPFVLGGILWLAQGLGELI